mmetsp:Transcript_22730/g.38965  ORF Transcript_22730/g.38965 Transcript_22730/m.38965 type:complete len:239 (+) Transcript_22730:69-785(+)|eukprot:CAMPEP_0196664860 /NCGR_PEP_ID=MMETSP1086-20130531/58724_1 /TAXON_ID=77921 /ORGANISM="Cyanoptyche  gloeocystis , Strain SAG4.97" /LENGTH=238 /DNA_ID=CAMNT_0042001347 /DNA_START=66 /DNA_END=782 /DNA_ORIENTATION=-
MSLFEGTESSDFDGAFKQKENFKPAGRRRQRFVEEDQPEDAAEGTEKVAPKAAKASAWGMGDEDGGASAAGASLPAADGQSSAAAPKGRRRGQSGTDGSTDISSMGASEDTSAKPRRAETVEDEMPTIPDLEDELEEDITRQVAAPPKIRNNRVQTIKELDHDIKYSLPSADIGIDLSLLASTLSPQDQVLEEDVPWEFEALLAEVSAEIQAEEDKKEEGAAEREGDEKGADKPMSQI